MKRMDYDEIRAEATGRLGAAAWCARVYRRFPMRMEWAYGETEVLARRNLEDAPEVLDLSEPLLGLLENGKGLV